MGQSGDCVCPSLEHHDHLVAQGRLRFDKVQGRLIPPLRVEHPFSLDVPVYAPEHLESRIAAIVKGFDADRVHKVMTTLDWRWGGSDMPVGGVPTVEQIREKAADLLRGTAAGFIAGKIGPGSGWGSGGLRTQISDKGELTVWFELSEQALGLAEIRIRQLGEQLASCEKALAERDARVLVLTRFVLNIRDGWDCDEDAHRHRTPCRCCEAEKLVGPAS
jgi:hypothetical protein